MSAAARMSSPKMSPHSESLRGREHVDACSWPRVLELKMSLGPPRGVHAARIHALRRGPDGGPCTDGGRRSGLLLLRD